MIQIVWRMTLVSKRGKSSMRNHITCACWGYNFQKADITNGGKTLALNRNLFGDHPPQGSYLSIWGGGIVFPSWPTKTEVEKGQTMLPARNGKCRTYGWRGQMVLFRSSSMVGSRVVSVWCDCDTLQIERKEWKQGPRGRTTEVEHAVFISVQVLTCRKT